MPSIRSTMSRLTSILVVCLLAVAVHCEPHAAEISEFSEAGTLRLKALSSDHLLEVFALASEARGRAQNEPGSSPVSERLSELLSALRERPADASLLSELQAAARAELAARLAAAAQRPGSRLRRLLTLTNIAWFLGTLLIAVALLSLFGIYVVALLTLIPLEAWEALGFLTASGLLHHALTRSAPAAAPHVALLALLLFTGCAAGTASRHLPSFRWRNQRAMAAFCALNAALYAGAAVRLQATVLGTLSVWWGVSALGFFIACFPFLTVIGFTGGLARPFGASLAAVLSFLPFKVAPERFPLPPALAPFQQGVWLWCPFVLNLASLLMAFGRGARGMGTDEAWPRILLKVLAGQLPALLVISATLAVGVGLDVEPCRAIGAIFAFLYVGTKLGELDWKRAGPAWATLAFGGLLWGFAYAVNTWPRFFLGSLAFVATGGTASAVS
ncbi:hypothetical protein ABPG75_005903 [Micractinium tetrahymenae]